MGKSLILAVVGALAIVSPPSLSQAQTSPPTQPEMIAYGGGSTPGFLAMTPAKAGLIGGLVGVAVMYATGAELIKKNGVVDPSEGIARDLAALLAERRMAVLAPQAITSHPTKPGSIAEAATGARYAVVVRTTAWDHMYYAFDWGRYSVAYSAHLQIIDVQAKTVVVTQSCGWRSPKAGAPTRDDLLRNQAEGLKAYFAKAAGLCVTFLQSSLDKVPAANARPIAPALLAAANVTPVPQAAPQIVEVRTSPLSALPPPAENPVPIPVEPARETALLAAPIPSNVLAAVSPAAPATLVERPEPLGSAPLPAYVEYPYARPDQAPPSRTRPPEYRYAGRDADGFLVWPGKQP